MLERDDRTIWTCYNRATKKRQQKPKIQQAAKEAVKIPLEIFKDRTFAPLERMAAHLKDNNMLSFHEIAVLLNRDDRTIWTCYHRAQKKIAK